MFTHLLKLIWQRKSRNLMLSLEILLAFLVVFVVAAFAVRNYQLYHLPIGFSYQDVWSIELQMPQAKDQPKDTTVYDAFKRGLQALPEVKQVAFASHTPYTMSTWNSDYEVGNGGPNAISDQMQVSDDFFAVMGMSIEQGRWFSAQDNGQAERAISINRRLADTLFPGQSALGKTLSEGEPGSKNPVSNRVTGVFDEFRNKGELMAPTNFVLSRLDLNADNPDIGSILIKLAPGTTRAFEAKLNQQLKLVRNDWGYRISPLSDLRKSQMSAYLIPLMILSVIAAFLLLMVAFGLFGVLWQNTTQRIPEIGLRRAIGANTGHIYRQIISEQMLLSTLAMLVALVLLVQLPITGAFGDSLNWPVFLMATTLSMLVIYGVSLLCALYPGWRASNLSPTEALHYE